MVPTKVTGGYARDWGPIDNASIALALMALFIAYLEGQTCRPSGLGCPTLRRLVERSRRVRPVRVSTAK
jgi:hypothetical protein